MNAIKNTIVSVTLLAVAFGAYQVLQNPPAHSLADNELTWDATPDLLDPDVPAATLPTADTLDSADSQQEFFDQINAPRAEQTQDPYAQDDAMSSEFVDGSAAYDESHAYDEVALDENDAPYEVPQESLQGHVPDAPVENTDTASSLTSFGVPQADSVPPTDGGYYDQLTSDASTAEPSNDPQALSDQVSQGAVDLPQTSESEAVVTDDSPTADEFENTLNYVKVQLQQDQFGEALLTLSNAYRTGLRADQLQRVAGLIDQLAGTVIYSSESYIQPVHQVTTDDTLESIAAKYKISPEFVARVNGLDLSYQPVVGESLKVLQGPFRAEIDRTANELTVYLGDYYAGRFVVQFGADVPRTPGEFEVVEKSAGREYFDRATGYRVAKDDPGNPYGHRWIGLRGEQVTAGHNVGIHVANENAQDAGCFRVSPVDAEDLSTILSIGSRVSLLR